MGITALRGVTGLTIALIVGAVWGAAIGRWPGVDAFCQPALQILLATPAVVFVVLALVWFGSSSLAVIFVVALVASPLMVKTTAGAVRNIDYSLDEMGQVFGLNRRARIRYILIPLVLPPYIAAATVVGEGVPGTADQGHIAHLAIAISKGHHQFGQGFEGTDR